MLLVVDATQLAYMAFFTGGVLSHVGSPTGVIYKFLLQLEAVARRAEGEIMVPIFCWDHRESKRKVLDPNYKRTRKTSEIEGIEVMFDQIHFLRTELKEVGFQSYIAKGLEADDLIANVCIEHAGEEKLIFSRDTDLYQLLDDKTRMLKAIKKKSFVTYTKAEFIKQYNIAPEDWALVKAIGGCSVDNVKGITGIGEKRAIDFILGTGSEKHSALILSNWKVVEHNLKLVFLPFEKVRFGKPKKWNYSRFHEMLLKKGIRNIDQRLWRDVYVSTSY